MRLDQVVLIGAGNIAWQLGQQIEKAGIPVAHVFSRSPERARELAQVLHCPAGNDLKKLPALDHCLYLLAVNDDSLPEVVSRLTYLSGPDRAFAHTSGAVSSQVFQGQVEKYGVFYPLQTISKDRPVDFRQVPFCIFSPDPQLEAAMSSLAAKISDQVRVISDEERKVLHVAAVFVNNFSNHLFSVGKQILQTESLSFDLLRPLIRETAAKVMENEPEAMQTGPAKRGDQKTILSHLHYLQQYPEFQNLYRVISHSLQQMYDSK